MVVMAQPSPFFRQPSDLVPVCLACAGICDHQWIMSDGVVNSFRERFNLEIRRTVFSHRIRNSASGRGYLTCELNGIRFSRKHYVAHRVGKIERRLTDGQLVLASSL